MMKTKALQGEVAFESGLSSGEYEFCGFRFPWLKGMKYLLDGSPGMRSLFIADKRRKIIIYFEEGMQCLDKCTNFPLELRKEQSEYKESDRYLHQVKLLSAAGKDAKDVVFFHMEVTDKGGKSHVCPGQMLLPMARRKQKGPEPLLMSLLSGLRIVET